MKQKKVYQEPAMTVIELQHETSVLQYSHYGYGSGGDAYDDGSFTGAGYGSGGSGFGDSNVGGRSGYGFGSGWDDSGVGGRSGYGSGGSGFD